MASTMRLSNRTSIGYRLSIESDGRSISAFVQLRFQLFDDLGVHLLGDLHLEQEDDPAQDDDRERHIECADLEGSDVRGGHVCRGGVTDHAGGDGYGPDDAVGAGTCDLIEHRADRQGDSLVALAVLQLAVFDGVGQRQDGGHLDEGLRQVEEDQADGDDRQAGGVDDEQQVSDDHEHHAAEVQVTARDAPVQDRIQRGHDDARDDGDDTDDGVGGGVVQDELEQVHEHAGGGHVGDGVQQVGQGDPQQLVVLGDRLERGQRTAVLLGLGAQRAGAFLGAERHGAYGEHAEDGHDDGEAGPAALAFLMLAGEHVAEEGDDRDDDDGQTVIADGAAEGAERGVGGTFVRIVGQRRNHAPEGDVAQGVEHVEHDEGDDEQHDEQRGVDVHQAEQAGVDQHEQHGGDGAADELPRLEAAPLGVGVVDDVAQQRIDEDLGDADDHHKAGDDADELGGERLVDSGEQRAGDVDDEVGAERVVERGLADVAERVGDAGCQGRFGSGLLCRRWRRVRFTHLTSP